MPVIDDLRAQYALTKKLGQGGFGTVYKAQRRSDRKVGGHSRAFLSIVSLSFFFSKHAQSLELILTATISPQIFAVKTMKVPSRLDAAFANAIIVEVQLLRQLDHVHIVHFEDYIETPLTKNIIMEFCSKGDLHTFINSHRSQG
jgi:serine/threonine protein kinase